MEYPTIEMETKFMAYINNLYIKNSMIPIMYIYIYHNVPAVFYMYVGMYHTTHDFSLPLERDDPDSIVPTRRHYPDHPRRATGIVPRATFKLGIIIHLSIYLSINLSITLSIYLSNDLSTFIYI